MVRVLVGTLAVAGLAATPAHAQECTDLAVEDSTAMNNLWSSGGFAQSFVAPCGDLRSVALFLDTWDYGSRDITVRIRQGAGVSGPVVGELVQAPPPGAYGYTRFDLSAIDLVAGQTYTLELVGAASRWAVALNQPDVTPGSDYVDGHLWIGGVERTDLDLRFRLDFGPYLPVCEDAEVTTSNGSYSLDAMGAMGQSFVATCADLRSFEVSLWPSGGTGSRDLTLRLHEGEGLSGPVVAEVTQTPADSHTGFYAFGVGAVTLVPGQTYTAEVVGGGNYWMLQSSDIGAGAAYPDGYMWLSGAFTGGQDLKFRVGFGEAPAPSAVAAQQIAGETFAAEDIPTAGSDGDFNDLALYHNRRCSFGPGGELARETIHFRALAAGASEINTLVLDLPGQPRNVVLYAASGAASLPAVDGTRVTLFDDFRDAFTAPSGTFLNTTDAPITDAPTWRLEIEYVGGQIRPVACGAAAFGLTRPAQGVWIGEGSTRAGNGMPLIGSFPGTFQVPREQVDLTTAYPEAALWLQAMAEGCAAPSDCHEDWFLAANPAQVIDRGYLPATLALPDLPTCEDGNMNAEETGIDCGGVCGDCATCEDGVLNGDEEDVDCGGSACSPCGDARIVFVTSQQYHAALGGVAGADQICQSHAAAAGLPGTFLAWLTDAAGAYAPSVRFDQGGGPFVRTDEVFVALDWADLTDGTLAASISLDEFGGDEWAVGDEYQLVWSNVSRRGTSRTFLNDDCVGWTDASIGQEYGGYGMYLRTDYHWSDSFHIFCHLPLRLYCMQQ